MLLGSCLIFSAISTPIPDLSAVIPGIITLGANGGEQLFLGSVCYSGDIESVLRDLSSQGVVKIEAGSVVVKNTGFLRKRLRSILRPFLP